MTIVHTDELRDMTPAERENELEELRTDLLNERAVLAAGGAPENPGRIRELRKAIARVKTIQREEGDLAGAEAGVSAGGATGGEAPSSAEAAEGAAGTDDTGEGT